MKKWLLVTGLSILLSLAGIGVAVAATGPYGRNWNNDYFTGDPTVGIDWAFVNLGSQQYDGLGPNCDTDCTVNLDSFLKVYHDRLYDTGLSGSKIDAGRAAAEIDVMLGQPGTAFNNSIPQGIAYAQAHYTDWKNLITAYADGTMPGYSVDFNVFYNFSTATSNGLGSTGVHDAGDVTDCSDGQQCRGDITFQNNYNDNGFDWAVVFHVNGKVFIIKHKCANLTNDNISLKIPSQPYNLNPTVNANVPGGATVAEPGDTITFTYTVANTGDGDSDPATCTLYSQSFSGYHQTPGAAPFDKSGTQSTKCSNKVFNGNSSTTVGTENVTVTAAQANTTICRTLSVSPATGPPGTGTNTDEACVPVANQPYVRVFGGDVSAGNAQPAAACNLSNDYNAAIVSWNSASGLYNGAGTQFAAFAVGDIDHFATSQTNVGTSKGVAPSGLSFANTTTGANGKYGGDLGSTALPCMTDYYNVPASATNVVSNNIDVGTLASGAYVYTGASTLTLHGTLADGAVGSRIQIFVPNHNVYIDNDIAYAPNAWQSIAGIPMFELVVDSGSIYVSNSVGRLDGTYIAQNSQANGQGTGGQIATCANAAGTAPAALDNNLYSNCNNQLVVNGAFVADDVLLERSVNTLSDSTTDSPANLSSSAAEQFNYNPSLWIVQPPTPPGALTYNTIVDLPPVL
jgi:hypothetical protein